jgi:hypothetical protein
MPFRVLLLTAAAAAVVLLLTYSLTRNRKYLAWAAWVGKLSLGLVLLFAILYVLERVILI